MRNENGMFNARGVKMGNSRRQTLWDTKKIGVFYLICARNKNLEEKEKVKEKHITLRDNCFLKQSLLKSLYNMCIYILLC